MQFPHVCADQSADNDDQRAPVAFLAALINDSQTEGERRARPKFLLATVKGDVARLSANPSLIDILTQ